MKAARIIVTADNNKWAKTHVYHLQVLLLSDSMWN